MFDMDGMIVYDYKIITTESVITTVNNSVTESCFEYIFNL